MIIFIIFSGCLDEEPVIQGDAQGNVITKVPTQRSSSISQNITVNITTIITTIPTPTSVPKQTPQPISISDGNEIPWCNIKRECDNGIRKYNSEMCISVHEMPNGTMNYYCGIAPIQTSSEDRPPRSAENGTLIINEDYSVGIK